MDDEIDGGAGAEDVLAEVPGGVGLGNGCIENVGDLGVLAADEDEGSRGVCGHPRDRDPLDQLMGVLEHQLAVLEGAGLGFVGVAAEVLLHLAPGQEAGLLAHREAGAAAASQATLLEFAEQFLGLLELVGLLERLVAAPSFVAIDRP